jgi:perosamine synthetase
VRERITPRTKGVIVVHMNGIPADLDALMNLADECKLFLIEDCSHAHGAEHAGRKVGTFGHVNAFSLQQKKNLSAGEGGIVTTNDATLAAKAREVANFGTKVGLGWNLRMTEVHAAVARVRLPRLDAENEQRRQNAAVLDAGLANLRLFAPPTVKPGDKAVYYNYVVRYRRTDNLPSKEQVIKALVAEGIPASFGYRPLHRHPTFSALNSYGRGCPFKCPLRAADAPSYQHGICPVTERLCDREAIELKIHPPAAAPDMADIVEAFRKVEARIGELG